MALDTPPWQAIRDGDLAAFEALFRAWYKPLCGYATRILRDQDGAEEVVQALFADLWERRQRLEVRTELRPYLYRAVLHRCLSALRASAKTIPMEPDPTLTPLPAAPDAAQSLEAQELELAIVQAVAALPPARRAIFSLSRFEGKTYNEIAAALGLSVKTVEAQMGKALASLRLSLADYLVTALPVLMALSLYHLFLLR